LEVFELELELEFEVELELLDGEEGEVGVFVEEDEEGG
jgi:hypothetical protein